MQGMRSPIRITLWIALGLLTIGLAPWGCGSLPHPELTLPGLSRLVEPEAAVTTSLDDAVTEAPFLDGFNPADPAPLSRLPRGPNRGFLLAAPGFYFMNTRSYCLHAGTYAPSGGDGYLYAPLSGPRAHLIRRLVQSSVDHPEIPQEDVQALVWAVLAQARLSRLSPEMQLTAARLLSESDLRSLDDVALDALTEAVRERAYENLPEPARRVLDAEARLRDVLASGQSTYEEIERAAVLFGAPPPQEGDREVPGGRWSYHPDGYFIRYFPNGYPRTEVQIYVPEPFTFRRDEEGRIAAIADLRGNRLEVEYDEEVPPLRLPGEPGTSARAFRAIRFTRFHAVGPEMATEEQVAVNLPGWTFLGALPARGGPGDVTDSPAQVGGFAGIEERHDSARRLQAELHTLRDRVARLRRNDPSGPMIASPDHDLMDLAHLDAALRTASGPGSSPRRSGTPDYLDMATKAWLYLLVDGSAANRRAATAPREWPPLDAPSGPWPGPTTPFAGAEAPRFQEEGLCDDLPGDQGRKPEFDPTEGAATPGSTALQRLLTSGVDAGEGNPDCGKVAEVLEGLRRTREAYASSHPAQGQSGIEYDDKLKAELGGASSPMGTELNSCVILGNRAYYDSQPPVVRIADCAHERVHQATCRWARDHAAGGFGGWLQNPNNYRQNELDAYAAGIKVLEDWMKDNGCSG